MILLRATQRAEFFEYETSSYAVEGGVHSRGAGEGWGGGEIDVDTHSTLCTRNISRDYNWTNTSAVIARLTAHARIAVNYPNESGRVYAV